jgi:hypothetical protein
LIRKNNLLDSPLKKLAEKRGKNTQKYTTIPTAEKFIHIPLIQIASEYAV